MSGRSAPAPLPVARLQVVAAALLFSTGGAAIKATSLSSWQVAGFRSGIAALTLVLILPAALRRVSWRAVVVGGGYAGALVCYALANKLTTAANTIFLQSAAPLYILLLGPWLLGERLKRRDLALLGALAVGLALFFVEIEAPVATAPDPFTGNLLAAGAGLFWALTLVGLRWLGRGRDDRLESTASVVVGNVLALAVCLPLALPAGGHGAVDWLVVVYLGVVQIGLAYVLLTAALRAVPAFEASLLILVEPVFNPIWAWWLHGERPGTWSLAGGLVILSAVAARVLREGLAARRRGMR